jgi:hypothetical protein
MPYNKPQSRLGAPQKQTAKNFTFPASTGGINALSPLISMPASDCIITDNIMPSEYGLRMRKGYREHATGVQGEVRTIIPFEAQQSSGAADKMWAVSENGIYDVTLYNTTAPVEDVTFTEQGDAAGWGVFTEFTNDASDRYLMYADGLNGLHLYQEGVGWSVPVITSEDLTFDVTDVAFVTAWKNRLWFIEESSGDAWYLPPDAIQGVVQKFTFGSKFSHGGDLIGLYNWTVDGGDGIDDFLVAVSRGGDVLIYHGTDPILPDFGLRGSYFIGEVPESRRLTVEYGGELYILSTYGVTSIRSLLQGSAASDPKSSPSAKISRFLRSAVNDYKDDRNWALTIHPADGFLQILTPFTETGRTIQYTQNLLTSGWGRWTNVPANCADTWSGDYYIGTKDGRVLWYEGTQDNTLLDGTPGEPIKFYILTSFQAPENHATLKRVSIIRPIGILAGTATINVKAIFDYNVAPILLDPPAIASGDETLWDTGVWDLDVWDYLLVGASVPVGALGVGRSFAVAMKGSTATRLNILGWDVLFTTGDIL